MRGVEQCRLSVISSTGGVCCPIRIACIHPQKVLLIIHPFLARDARTLHARPLACMLPTLCQPLAALYSAYIHVLNEDLYVADSCLTLDNFSH